jgi:D-alanine-D-alanine ligase
MNKIYCKSILRAAGLPVLPWVSLNRDEWSKDLEGIVEVIETDLGYPVFVKPANMGSSVGINKSDDRLHFVEHVKTALEYDDYVLVEEGIAAREIEVAVLGGFEPRASIPGEIVPGDVFYSYEAKYLTEDSKLVIPAPLTPDQQTLLRDLAVETFKVLQLDGLARVDFLVDKDSGEAWVNEPNTIPGFTSISMYPKLWEESGVPYSRLLERLIELGRQRHLRRSRFSVDR